jgi:[ribosomal protein S18]-alanine N-acetyltransferase
MSEIPDASSIRPATPDDVSAVWEVEHRVYSSPHATLHSPWTLEHFQTELTKPYSHFLVLTDDETDSRILAYIVFWMMFEECQILNVAVDMPYRGMGYGKLLVRKAVSLALQAGLKRILLEVRVSNTAAIQLYQALGFGICQVRRQFYADGEDAYSMVLELSGSVIDF